MTGELAIDVHGMTKRFGSRVAVDPIDFRVRAARSAAFWAPTAAARQRSFACLRPAMSGCGPGACLGHDVITQSEAVKLEVGYMTQRFSFWEDLTIAENLDFVAPRLPRARDRRQAVQESLERLGLDRLGGTNWPVNSRVDGSSGWHWRPASFIGPSCCCSMNRLRVSIPRPAGISGRRFTSWRTRG